MKLRVLEDGEAQTRRVITAPVVVYGDGRIEVKGKPRYHVGETVYIKEAWAATYRFDRTPIGEISHDEIIAYKDSSYEVSPYRELRGKWRSPFFMPEWAARYFIQITRVEACQTKDITWTDCVDEGIKSFGMDGNVAGRGYWSWDGDLMFNTPQRAYFAMYDSINGKGAHERNWDWKYTFKRVVR